jgi:hypothetical protein
MRIKLIAEVLKDEKLTRICPIFSGKELEITDQTWDMIWCKMGEQLKKAVFPLINEDKAIRK